MGMTIKRQVNESILLMNENDSNHVYKNISKIQAFGGDNFKEVCNKLNVTGKRALTVCGSADHPLELAIRGFSYIDAFDINILAEHILNLKIAAILTLNYEEYMLFAKNLFKEKELFFKISQVLNSETLYYFESLFKMKNDDYIYKKLFTHKYCGIEEMLMACKNNFSIYNEKDFYSLKMKIASITIKFKNQDLFQRAELKDNYDFIYFSNIFLFNSSKLKEFKETLLPNYLNHLNEKGILVLDYLHHFVGNDCQYKFCYKYTQMLNEMACEEFKDTFNCELEISSSNFGKGLKENDLILVLKK